MDDGRFAGPSAGAVCVCFRRLLGLDPETADREIERALDVAHEHALKVFETIDRSLSEIAEIVRGVADADIVAREQVLHLRLKQLVASLPQVKSAWIFDAKGHALVNSLVAGARDRFFRPGLFQGPRAGESEPISVKR